MEATQAKKDFVVKKQLNRSLSVRIIGLLLSFLIGTQPLMALAPKTAAEQEQTLNPLFKRLFTKTLLPLVSDRNGFTSIGRALTCYLTKPEMRKNFLDERVEENSHLLEILFLKQKKCVTDSGFVRTVYESLIVNDTDALHRKQDFIKGINPSEIDGALREVSLGEKHTLHLACEREEFNISVDTRLLPPDLSMLHDILSQYSTPYQKAFKNLKFIALRYPVLTLAALYAYPAFVTYAETSKLRKEFFPTQDEKLKKLIHLFDPATSSLCKADLQKYISEKRTPLLQALNEFEKQPKGTQVDSSHVRQMEKYSEDLGWQGNISPIVLILSAIRYVSLQLKGDAASLKNAQSWSYLKGSVVQWNQNLQPVVTLAICAWSLKNTLSMFKQYQNHLVHVARSLKAAHNIYLYLQKKNLLQYLTPDEQKAFAQIFDKTQQNDTIKRLFDVLDTATFKTPMTSTLKTSIPWHAGRIGSAATLLNEAKTEIQQLFLALGHVDYITGLKKMVTDSEEQTNSAQEPLKFSFVEFVDSTTPIVELKNAWFPLYETNAVPTDISLGAQAQPHHLLITGVNGTGKSGVMLSTLTCITMGMSHGIAPAEHAHMTPFANIHAHMNVGDDQRAGKSGFTNEMKLLSQMMARIQKNNDANKQRTKPEFFFVLQDETFRSTDKDNAYQLGWGLMNFLNNDPYTLSLCASHVYELSAIEKATNGNVKNAYMHSDVVDGEDGYQKPVHSRKIKFGINQVRGMAIPIALEALKKEGLLTPHIKALFATKPPMAGAAA